MAASKIEELSHGDILLNMIFLKPGGGNFKIEDLQKGLKKCSEENPRLTISPNTIENTFFFYHPYLCGQLDIPDYCLSQEGKRIFQKGFDSYEPVFQKELKTIAERVWTS